MHLYGMLPQVDSSFKSTTLCQSLCNSQHSLCIIVNSLGRTLSGYGRHKARLLARLWSLPGLIVSPCFSFT